MRCRTFETLGGVLIHSARQRNQLGLTRSSSDADIRLRSPFLPGALFSALALVAMATPAFPQAFTVTLEGPKLQQSSLLSNRSGFGAVNLHQEAFDELPATFIQTPVPFAANPRLGSYNHVLIRPADAFGGAGGTGKYLTINANINAADTSTTLTLATPQRYFGLWWSAGDPNNVLQFYSGSTLLETFTTNSVVNFINKQSNKSAYYGNPNNGKDTREPFAFLNFFANPSDPSVTFDRVVLTNSGSSGFEQDNHTIASSYIDIVGTAVDTLPALIVGSNAGSNQMLGVNGGSPSGASLSVAETTTVGDAGGGNLAVTNGGVLNCGTDVVGNQPGSSGTVTVNGAGSTVNSAGDVTVGNGGTGNLTVINGGTVNAGTPTSTGNVNIANSPGSMGSASVDGAGSSLTSTGNIEVGNAGSGTLSVTNRGTVTDANGTIGSQPGSLGVVTVDGSGSQWNNIGTLTVGPSGTGLLDVTDGGAVTAKGGTVVGPNGTVMGDGTITTPMLVNNGKVTPTGPNGTPDTLKLNGNYTQNSSGILNIQFASESHGLLAIGGQAFLGGTLRLSLLNGFVPPSVQRFTILTAAAGVNGTFNLVQQPTANVFTVFYDPKDVQVEVRQVPFQNFACDPNTRSVLTALQSVRNTATGDLGEIIGVLNGLPTNELCAAGSQISPLPVPSLPTQAINYFDNQSTELNSGYGFLSSLSTRSIAGIFTSTAAGSLAGSKIFLTYPRWTLILEQPPRGANIVSALRLALASAPDMLTPSPGFQMVLVSQLTPQTREPTGSGIRRSWVHSESTWRLAAGITATA